VNANEIQIAVIQYPGTNCEYETAEAIRFTGMQAELFRWNRDPGELDDFDGYVFPGGFSYQDRIRAGAVASRKQIIRSILTAAETGKPVLGICNGAQILIESGMTPGITWGDVQMSLARNKAVSAGGVKTGFHCDWIFVRNAQKENPGCFNLCYEKDEVFPVPVAHAEGRFTTADPEIAGKLTTSNLVGFQYCDANGNILPNYPFNPNGALLNIAGLYNVAGNVLAFMPHPERATWLRQVPVDLPAAGQSMHGPTAKITELRKPGPGARFFESMKRYILKRKR